MSSDSTPVTFCEKESRDDEMHQTIEQWLSDLSVLVDEARASEEFRTWLDVQSRFHDYSYRNTLLIKQQCPGATKVAGYRTWQRAFDRQVREGESAIWIWAPIVTKRCPACENGESYHERSGCEYDERPPDEWSEGLVGFRPVPVFDVSQTEGEALPELETAASGEAGDLLKRLLEAADDLGIDARLVPPEFWRAGNADGICKFRPDGPNPRVDVLASECNAEIAGVLVHEYAHALLHAGVDDATERAKREVEAEAVAYVVTSYFGLDAGNSAFYLAAWHGEDADVLEDRLERITETARTVIRAVEREERSE